jgi:Tfp pilus assembly PilM family ATPase
MRSTRVLTLDFGAAHVACGLFSAAAGRLVLEHFGTQPVVPSELKDDDWVAAVGAALRELGRLKGFQGGCIVGLPGHLTFNRLIRVPPVSARQRRQILRFEEGQGLPAALDEMVWSHAPVSVGASGQEVILAAAKLRMMTALGAQLRVAGFYPAGAIPAWAVLRSALRHTYPEPAEMLVLSIGARSSQLYLHGTSRCYLRTLAAGGNTVTQKIAEELGVDFARAEVIKREVLGASAEFPADSPERMAVQISVEQFVRRICGEISRSPVLWSPDGGGRRPQNLLLTGGGSLVQGLPALLAEKLQVRVERWEPWLQVDLGQAVADLPGKSEATQAADLVGLAAWAADRELSEVNLLPGTLRREMFVRRRWPWLASVALVTVMALLLPGWRYRSAARAARTQAGAVDAKIGALRRLETRNRTNLGRLEETNRRISALRRLAASRSSWAGFLGDLQDRLAKTEDAWLERLQVLPAVQPASSFKSAPGGAGPKGAEVGESAGGTATAADVRLHLTGGVFDADSPMGKNGEGSYQRVKLLLASLWESPFVAGIESERFDGSQAGVLRFEITMVLAPHTLF